MRKRRKKYRRKKKLEEGKGKARNTNNIRDIISLIISP